MSNGGKKHNAVIVWNGNGFEDGNGGLNDPKQGVGSMRNPDTFTQKEVRRKKIRRDAQYDRFSDTVKERKPRKPRVKNIKYYEYSEWDE